MLEDYRVTMKKTNIKSKGHEVKQFRILRKDKKIMDKNEMIELGNNFLKLKRSKLEKNGKTKGAFKHASSVHTPYGWRSSTFRTGELNFNVYDASAIYGDEDEEYPITTGDAFSIFIYDTPDMAGGCTKNNNNDCLFYCLKTFLGDLLRVKFPGSLKKLLKLKRNEPVPLSCLSKVEDRYKVNIIVEGDHTYVSSKKYPRTMYLILKDGHYTLNKKKTSPTMTKKFRKDWIVNKEFVVYDKENIYDGKKMISRENLKVSACGKQYFKLELLNFIRTKDLIEAYQILKDEIEKIEKVDQRLSPRYYQDFNGNMALNHITTDYFYYHANGLNNPEPIGQEEGIWLMKSFRGGLIYAKKGQYKNTVKYDVNSFYPSLQKSLIVPRSKPDFEIIDDEEIKIASKLGIYRCEIEKGCPFFRYTPENYYTSHDVSLARELSLKITMIQDCKPNFMNYGRGLTMSSAFGPSVDKLYDLKQKGHKIAKYYLNCLWGQLSKSSKRLVLRKKDEELNLECDILWIHDNCERLFTIDEAKIFTNDFGRLAPFLTSRGRKYIYNHFKDHKDKLIQCHTDGFILDGNIELPIGNKIGELKLEKSGSCEIIHVNSIKYS